MNKKALPQMVRLSLDKLAPPDARLLLAVSGGSDSMGMLHLIRMTRDARLLRVGFVDHGLRSGVDREWQLVAEQCDRLDVAATRCSVSDQYDQTRDGEGLQQWARHRRYRLLAELAAALGCNYVVTGHTLDDQAETVLLRLLRGTGLDGLGAVPPKRKLDEQTTVIRPMLGIQREEIRQWLRAEQIHWAEDPSNSNERFARVQARRLMPKIAGYNPKIQSHLSALSQEARDVTQWLNETLVSNIDIVPLHLNNGYCVKKGDFARIPVSLHGRIVRLMLQKLAGHLLRFERIHIEDVVSGLHSAGRCREYVLPGGYHVWTAYGALYIFPPPSPAFVHMGEQKLVQVSSNMWEGQHNEIGVSVRLKSDDAKAADWLSTEGALLALRSVRAGDRVYCSNRKVSRLLGDFRVPVMYRGYVPGLITPAGEVISIPRVLNSRVSGLLMEWHLHKSCALKDLIQFE
ncbi:MAG: tRNA lysidine(34) synthetase TilS [Deltaproteobacteria bacterium]|nr:tRNA lysidine(34) synthetase TilS [Deltaproteobacteria bacterium]